MKTYWIVKGTVTDAEAHDYKASVGETEWRFCDSRPENLGLSFDYLSIEQGIKDLSPAIFIVED